MSALYTASRTVALCLLVASGSYGQNINLPKSVPQGNVIRIDAAAPAVSARMLDRTIHLFPQSSGDRLGLMPVPATQKPGVYRLDTLDTNGAVLHEADITVEDAHFEEQNVKIKPKLMALRPTPAEAERLRAFRETVSDVRYWHEPLALPVPGCMTSPFGFRRLYNGKPGGNYQ